VNRIAHLFEDLDDLLDNLEPVLPAPGLRIQRAPLITLVQTALAELRDRRGSLTGSRLETDLEWDIRYWEDVLTWLQQERGRYLDMFSATE
jgi:hypothetical protein